MNESSEQRVTATSDRRAEERRPSDAILRVQLDSQTLQAKAEDISAAGVYFFSGEELRVMVEIEENGEVSTCSGRLVRVARMSAEQTGYAIEFDRA